jgi:hypothetical protein
MAFVIGPTSKDEEAAFQDYLLRQQKELTQLTGKAGAQIFVVADYLLEELGNLSLPSRPLSKSELINTLTPDGLVFCRHLLATRPEAFSFDGRLPPVGMRTATVLFHEEHLSDVCEVLSQRTDQELSFKKCFGVLDDVCVALLQVQVDLPTSECDEVGEELSNRNVIGASPLSRLLLGRNPDR